MTKPIVNHATLAELNSRYSRESQNIRFDLMLNTTLVNVGLEIVFAAAVFLLSARQATADEAYDTYDKFDDVGVYMLTQDIDHHFNDASQDFEDHNFGEAAQEIYKAVSFLEIKAVRSSGDRQKTLNDDIDELKKLADDVDNGRVTSVKELHDAFAKTQYVLSENAWIKAADAFDQKDYAKASKHLHTSQTHLEQALAWVVKQEKKKEKAAGKKKK